jgi:hypothetical protein
LAPKTKRQRTTGPGRAQEVLDQAISFLRDEYENRLAAFNIFPAEIQHLSINCKMMDDWSDDFIPPDVRDNTNKRILNALLGVVTSRSQLSSQQIP